MDAKVSLFMIDQDELLSVSGGEAEVDLSDNSSASAVSPLDEEGAGTSDSSSASAVSPFELFFEDQSKLEPKLKIRLIMACCIGGLVEGFDMSSLQSIPFSSQNLFNIKPNKVIVRAELKRRDPGIKNISNIKLDDLMVIMTESNKKYLSEKCIKFILTKFREYKDVFQSAIDA